MYRKYFQYTHLNIQHVVLVKLYLTTTVGFTLYSVICTVNTVQYLCHKLHSNIKVVHWTQGRDTCHPWYHCTALLSTVQCTVYCTCTVPFFIALHFTILNFTAQHCDALNCTSLYFTKLYYTVLHCTSLHWTAAQLPFWGLIEQWYCVANISCYLWFANSDINIPFDW